MGLVYADLELISSDDLALLHRGYLKADQVRKTKVSALVDSGAYMLCINENIKTQLNLKRLDEQVATMANGHQEVFEVVGPVEVLFENRSTSVRALVLPGDNEVLLGAIPMEDMDVMIDPKGQKLIVNPKHPFVANKSLK